MIAWSNTKNNFPQEPEKMNLKVQRTLANTSKISVISFISPVLLSVSYEVQHSFLMFGVARNDFLWEDI